MKTGSNSGCSRRLSLLANAYSIMTSVLVSLFRYLLKEKEIRTICKCGEHCENWNGLACSPEIPQPFDQLIDPILYDRLKSVYTVLGKEEAQSSSSHAMEIVMDGRKHRVWSAELTGVFLYLVPALFPASIEHIVEFRVGDMNLVWPYAHDWSLQRMISLSVRNNIMRERRTAAHIFLVHLLDLPDVLPSQYGIVPELIS
jgi:hypothetical protein